jgi:predicted house-cleaning noncanonical NTP pyrophosphatase (MazG superfamily)
MPDDKISAMSRMHDIDYKKQWEETLKNEYQEYLSNLNGNWLL